MSKLVVMCKSDAALGFELAGVETLPVDNPADTADRVRAALDDGRYGLLVLDEQLADRLPPRLKERTFTSSKPLVVILDLGLTRSGEEPDVKAFVQEMVRKAVGYPINLK